LRQIMKNLLIMASLLMTSLLCVAFEDERLNTLLNQLETRKILIDENYNRGSTTVLTVGADVNCQYSLIKSALNVANANGTSDHYEIRVAHNKTYTENLVLSKKNLTLKGGYSNCTNANNGVTDNTHTEIDGSTAVVDIPVIIVSNNNTNVRNLINIINFDITGGVGTMTNPGGGIHIKDNNIEVNIENSLIFDNEGLKGGGVYAEGDATTVYLKDTILVLNNAINGGGMYCDAAQILMYGISGISANNATGTSFNGSGGGLYATNACEFNLFSGTDGGLFDFRGIAGNTANRDGGGIYADLGTQVLLMGYFFFEDFGNNDEPINITGNKANLSATTRLGGGIYAADSETNLSAYATIINNNETLAGTTSTAAAMYIYQADFSLSKLNSPCWDQQKCNQIVGNKVFGNNSSNAGITALTGSDIKIKNTWISGHSASSNVFLFGQSITATIEGNVFTGNGGSNIDGNSSLLSFFGDANGISIANNTFAKNEINTALLRINNSPSMLVHGNIFRETNNVNILQIATGTSNNAQFNCMIVHENQSFSGSSIFVDNPEFVDELNEDFHLIGTSPAIDLCGEGTYVANTKDLDDESRAWDDLLNDNNNGAYDAGADEFYPATTSDLSVTKELLTNAPYYVDGLVTYQITVTNNGPDTATNIHVEDTPSGMTISSVSSANCSGFPCVIASLNNGNSEIINVTATLRSTVGVFDNSVTVYSEDYDANTSDNIDSSNNGGTVVLDHVDMQVAAFDLVTLPPYHSGQFLTVQVEVTNNGPDNARNVVIGQTTQSTNIEVVNVTGAPCVQWPCNIASFASGATVNLSLTVKIITGGNFRFGILVGTDSTDDNLNNNSDSTAMLIAQNTGNLSINSDLITPSPYIQGQAVEIELEIENNGPNEIGMIEVSAVLSNLSIDSISGSGCASLPCGDILLINGESMVINVMATISNSGDFSLDASVNSSNSFDPDENDNSSEVADVATANSDVIFENSFED